MFCFRFDIHHDYVWSELPEYGKRIEHIIIILLHLIFCNTFLQIKNGLIFDTLTITRVDQPHYKLGLWLIWQNLIQNVNPAIIIDQDSMLPGHKEVSKSVLGLISHFSFLHNFVTFLSCFSNSASFASILQEYRALWMLETRQEKDQVLSFNPCATVGLHTDRKICQKKNPKIGCFH